MATDPAHPRHGEPGAGRSLPDALAWGVSYVLNPLWMLALCFFIPLFMEASRLNLVYGLVHVAFLVLLFLVYMGYLRATGRKLDFELNRRADRVVPLAITIAGLTFLGIVFWIWQGTARHVYINVAASAMFAVFWALTSQWKVSLHSLATSLFLTGILLLMELSWPFWFLLLLIPLVVWARIHLKFHNLGQTLAGIVLGVAMVLFYQWLLVMNPLRLLP